MNVLRYSIPEYIKNDENLNSIINKRTPLSIFKKNIFRKTVFVIGAGPSLEMAIPVIKKHENITKIVADGAVEILIKHKIRPDILVTDLDGDMKSIKKIGSMNTPIIVHALSLIHI